MRSAIFFAAIMITDHIRGTENFSDFYEPGTCLFITVLILVFVSMDCMDFIKSNFFS